MYLVVRKIKIRHSRDLFCKLLFFLILIQFASLIYAFMIAVREELGKTYIAILISTVPILCVIIYNGIMV